MTNNPTFSQITKPHPSTKQPKRPNQVTLTSRHPTNKPYPSQTPKTKITPKASQTADLNCLNFKLVLLREKALWFKGLIKGFIV